MGAVASAVTVTVTADDGSHASATLSIGLSPPINVTPPVVTVTPKVVPPIDVTPPIISEEL